MCGIIILSTLIQLSSLWKTEKNLISRLSTLPALFMDIWPQYRALRVLWFRFVKEDLMKTRKERRNFEHNLNQTGK